MIELNINEINKYGIKKQPIEYNSEKELIKWLKYDLLQQALKKGKKHNKNKIITIMDDEEKNYTLNIGNKKLENIVNNKINIKFKFNFHKIIDSIFIDKTTINKKIIKTIKSILKLTNITTIYMNINCSNLIINNNIIIKEITIYNKISFDYSVFNDKIFLFKSNFNDISFNYVSIYKLICFMNSSANSIYFNDIKFVNNKSVIDIISYNELIEKNEIIKIKNIYITNTIIYGKINITNTNIDKIDLKGSIISNDYQINIDKNYTCSNSETARLLKNDAYRKYNYIKALEYQAEETRLHKEELKEQFKENKNLKTLGDILSIELSSLYSDNGQNWIKAFICTILFPSVFFTLSSYINFNVGLCFYILFIAYAINILFFKDILKYIINSILVYLIACLLLPLLYIEISNLDKSYIKELFIFLIPTNFEQIKDSLYIYNDNTLFRGFNYFIGKIAFWYGSVQTVQAFRKFAKGA
ncbi:hypothetical protein [Brachyspira intermedia]|uniref:hypothetical protein n=1 Tax=Brachyspira intermedia TaxID=84377 RepID=UPI003004E875